MDQSATTSRLKLERLLCFTEMLKEITSTRSELSIIIQSLPTTPLLSVLTSRLSCQWYKLKSSQSFSKRTPQSLSSNR